MQSWLPITLAHALCTHAVVDLDLLVKILNDSFLLVYFLQFSQLVDTEC